MSAPHKNYDPQMHTVQHILQQTMMNLYGVPQIDMHLEKKKSKCDFTFDHALTENEKKDIEQNVNGIITRKTPVEISMVPRSEIPPTVDISKLPADVQSANEIRIVKIGDPANPFNIQACIGDHVSNTSEIKGLFKITTHSFEGSTLRLRWTIK